MRIKVSREAALPEVLRQLGVQEEELARVTTAIARTQRIDVERPLPAGTELHLDDDLFVAGSSPATAPAARPTAPPRAEGAPASGGPPGRPLGVLGLFGVRRASELRSGENPLGSLSSLSATDILTAGAHLLDRVKLDVTVPLRAGVHAIPIGDKRVLVEIPPHTVLSLSSTAGPRAGGIAVEGAELSFSKSLQVKNPADLSFLGGQALGALANSLVELKLDGIAVAKDGAITPRGTLSRPSANPLKHLFSTGRSGHALESLVTLVGKPRATTSVADLAKGDVLKERPAFSASDLPTHFDLGVLLTSLGAMTEGGSFRMHIAGRHGFVDVGSGRATVVGAERALTATVTGDFRMEKGGAVDVSAELKTAVAMPVKVGLGEGGAPHAGVGPLSVTAREGGIDVAIGGAMFAVVRALADRLHVAIPDGVSLKLEGDALVSARGRVRLEDGGLIVEDGQVRAVIDASQTEVKAETFDVSLGEGSTIELRARGLSTRDGEVLIETVEGGFQVTAAGAAQQGLVKALVDDADAQGSFSLRLDEDVTGEAGFHYSLRARPKVLGIPLPRARVQGDARVVLGKDAIAVHDGARLKLGA
jgi:hypothetical protein